IFGSIFRSGEYDYVVFLDPDIRLYSDVEWIDAYMNDKSILVTPHILDSSPYRSGYIGRQPAAWRGSPSIFHFGGAYNLGFVAIKNDDSGRDFVDFWADLLRGHCFKSYCYDQNWVEFISTFYGDRFGVARDPGANVALWNLHERSITGSSKDGYRVNG